MTFHDFVKKAVEIFVEKKKEKYTIDERVFRGRSRTSSSEIENLLAKAIIQELSSSYSILIDFPISFKKPGFKRAKTIYPDISIVKDNILQGVVEFKIDLGYLHEDWGVNSQKNFSELIDFKGQFTFNSNGIPEDKKLKAVSSNAFRCVVVLSGLNGHGRISKFIAEEKNCFILFPKIHPNGVRNFNNEVFVKDFVQKISEENQNWLSFLNFISDKCK